MCQENVEFGDSRPVTHILSRKNYLLLDGYLFEGGLCDQQFIYPYIRHLNYETSQQVTIFYNI